MVRLVVFLITRREQGDRRCLYVFDIGDNETPGGSLTNPVSHCTPTAPVHSIASASAGVHNLLKLHRHTVQAAGA